MLYLAGIVITIFLEILLAGKRYKNLADGILIIWLTAIAFHLFLYFLFITGKIYNNPGLMGIQLPYPLLHGPLLFLYTVALTGHEKRFKTIWLIHFAPAIIIYLFLIPFFSLPAIDKINVYHNKGAGYETLMAVCLISIIISGITYVTASLVLLRRFRKSIEEEFSDIEKIKLAWLRYLIYGIAVIWLAVIFGSDPLIYGITVLFVFFLGYFGIRQTGIFTRVRAQSGKQQVSTIAEKTNEPVVTGQEQHPPDEKPFGAQANSSATKIKYEKSGLTEDQAGNIHERLVATMTNQKLFTEPELTLGGLAKTMNVHPNHLSQVINSFEGKNFYDYINFQRVEEFKKIVPRPGNRNYTLLSLAFECGFNSKTSFNRNFKKVTGISPSEYLLQQHISLE